MQFVSQMNATLDITYKHAAHSTYNHANEVKEVKLDNFLDPSHSFCARSPKFLGKRSKRCFSIISP